MMFLGTGAAECVPNPFCSCELCQAVRATGDPHEIRRRSSFLYDEHTLLDCNPDTMYACMEYGVSLEKLKRVLLTHSHSDHFCFESVDFIKNSLTRNRPITLYASKELCVGAEELLMQSLKSRHPKLRRQYEKLLRYSRFVPLEPYRAYQMNELTVEPLRSSHQAFFENEYGLLYLLTQNGQTLLYASDTGILPTETLRYLCGRHVDLCMLEGTFGRKLLDSGAGHLDLRTLSETIRALSAQQTIDETSCVVVTHISHHSGLLRAQYREALKNLYPGGLDIAFDGMQFP